MPSIRFFYNNINPHLAQRSTLKSFLIQLFQKEQQPLDSLTYVFCTDEYLLSINQSFLQHDFFTDIITFNLNEIGEKCIGEVYISVDRVKENAKNLKTYLLKK